MDRLARLTEVRAYARAQFLREDADVDWTDIGAKVKKLVDERISAQRAGDDETAVHPGPATSSRKIASPTSRRGPGLGDGTCDSRPDSRAASRKSGVFYESDCRSGLARIIEDLRNRLIDSAEACRRLTVLQRHVRSEADVATEHGLSPVSFAVYELLDGRSEGPVSANAIREEQPPYRTEFDEDTKRVALKVESIVALHNTVVDWQSNLEVQREMRRDVKRELRLTGRYTEERLEELASRIVELARRRSGQ